MCCFVCVVCDGKGMMFERVLPCSCRMFYCMPVLEPVVLLSMAIERLLRYVLHVFWDQTCCGFGPSCIAALLGQSWRWWTWDLPVYSNACVWLITLPFLFCVTLGGYGEDMSTM